LSYQEEHMIRYNPGVIHLYQMKDLKKKKKKEWKGKKM